MSKAKQHIRSGLSFLRDFVIPPICPSCEARLPIDNPYSPFCTECRGSWEKEKLARCPRCGLAMLDCMCLPPLLSENGIRNAVFLTAYRSGGRTVPSRLIYYIKANRDGRAFGFLGRELSYRIRLLMRSESVSSEDTVVTFLPRRRQGMRENGFDQAEVLARVLAEELGCEFYRLIGRRRNGREQKTLNAEERRENLRNAFRLRSKKPLTGKCVLLVDDVMTTGSGIYACAELLLGAGAERVIPVVVARTEECGKTRK